MHRNDELKCVTSVLHIHSTCWFLWNLCCYCSKQNKSFDAYHGCLIRADIKKRWHYCCISSCWFWSRRICICGNLFWFLKERQSVEAQETLCDLCWAPCTLLKYLINNWKPEKCLSPNYAQAYSLRKML